MPDAAWSRRWRKPGSVGDVDVGAARLDHGGDDGLLAVADGQRGGRARSRRRARAARGRRCPAAADDPAGQLEQARRRASSARRRAEDEALRRPAARAAGRCRPGGSPARWPARRPRARPGRSASTRSTRRPRSSVSEWLGRSARRRSSSGKVPSWTGHRTIFVHGVSFCTARPGRRERGDGEDRLAPSLRPCVAAWAASRRASRWSAFDGERRPPRPDGQLLHLGVAGPAAGPGRRRQRSARAHELLRGRALLRQRAGRRAGGRRPLLRRGSRRSS